MKINHHKYLLISSLLKNCWISFFKIRQIQNCPKSKSEKSENSQNHKIEIRNLTLILKNGTRILCVFSEFFQNFHKSDRGTLLNSKIYRPFFDDFEFYRASAQIYDRFFPFSCFVSDISWNLLKIPNPNPGYAQDFPGTPGYPRVPKT